MQIQFIGSGGAFDFAYGNSAALLRCQNQTFLIDCGFTVYTRLKERNHLSDIDYVLITHLHNDHAGSLPNTLLDYTFNINPGKKLKLIYPSKKFRKQISASLDYALVDADKFIDWVSIKDLDYLDTIDTYGKHVKNFQTYGYCFREGGETYVYSGDIGDGDYIFRKLKKKKVTGATVFHDITFSHSNEHTYYSTLMKHASDYKIFGYHCDPTKNKSDNLIPLVADQPEFRLRSSFE
jgi:ribonuclease BN (tRNA processing enzyme)